MRSSHLYQFRSLCIAVRLLVGPKFPPGDVRAYCTGTMWRQLRVPQAVPSASVKINGGLSYAAMATSINARRRALDALIDIGSLILRSPDDDHSNDGG
ncbi:hypothetical protein BST61_g1462 [Cercospora zeina]